MEELLTQIYANSSTPVLSAAILGLMTAISPCPLATNITAMGFISRDISRKSKVFYNGLIYTAGRAFAYTTLALILFFGADQFKISSLFQQYGEKILGPALIVIGLFMIGILSFNLPSINRLTQKFQEKDSLSYLDAFLLGILFALAFCPYSGVLYFGMLIPMTVQSASGLYLPVIFALTTGIPVIIFAWLLAYSLSGVNKLYNGLKSFEVWFRRVVALLFIGIGIYYTYIVWLA